MEDGIARSVVAVVVVDAAGDGIIAVGDGPIVVVVAAAVVVFTNFISKLKMVLLEVVL